MRREPRAYVADIITACDAIALDVSGVDVGVYLDTRAIRSAVEREFIIIGEAVNILGDLEPDVFARITQARTIVDFRNQLTHGYMTVNDKLVWGMRFATPRFSARNAPSCSLRWTRGELTNNGFNLTRRRLSRHGSARRRLSQTR